MEFAEIPRPHLQDAMDDFDDGVTRRNPLFYSGTQEPVIPSFSSFGNNITGDFLRPGLKSDGVLNLPRYHPKYTMNGDPRNSNNKDDLNDELEFLEVFDEPRKSKKKKNSMKVIQQQPTEVKSETLYHVDAPDEMIEIHQFDIAKLQEKVAVENYRSTHNSASCYACCYSPTVFLCRTVPSCCYPVTPWIRHTFCLGFVLVVNIFLMLLVLAIGLELGTDGFSKNANASTSPLNNFNNLMSLNNLPCAFNATGCAMKSGVMGIQSSSYHQQHVAVMFSISGILTVYFNANRT